MPIRSPSLIVYFLLCSPVSFVPVSVLCTVISQYVIILPILSTWHSSSHLRLVFMLFSLCKSIPPICLTLFLSHFFKINTKVAFSSKPPLWPLRLNHLFLPCALMASSTVLNTVHSYTLGWLADHITSLVDHVSTLHEDRLSAWFPTTEFILPSTGEGLW